MAECDDTTVLSAYNGVQTGESFNLLRPTHDARQCAQPCRCHEVANSPFVIELGRAKLREQLRGVRMYATLLRSLRGVLGKCNLARTPRNIASIRMSHDNSWKTEQER